MFFYAIIMEADMRLSYADLHVPLLGTCPICKRRNSASGHWNGGCAVGKPRLVDPPVMAGVSREGVVIRHNRLTEWV